MMTGTAIDYYRDRVKQRAAQVQEICSTMWARIDTTTAETKATVQPKVRRAPASKVNHTARYRQLKRNKLKSAWRKQKRNKLKSA